MAYSKFTTLITGFSADPATRPVFPNRAACASDAEYSELASAYEAWGKVNYKSTRRAGVCKVVALVLRKVSFERFDLCKPLFGFRHR